MWVNTLSAEKNVLIKKSINLQMFQVTNCSEYLCSEKIRFFIKSSKMINLPILPVCNVALPSDNLQRGLCLKE